MKPCIGAIICLIISWYTLECHFAPTSTELHEVTLIKLLYLYDPEACGRVHFYNITMKDTRESYSTIMWLVKNSMASAFRSKIHLWLCLHVLWFGLSIANGTHGQRHCGFYAVVVPFTITGVTLLVVDLIYMSLFLQNVQQTNSQISILNFMNSSSPSSIRWINRPFPWPAQYVCDEDSTWISLLFAYISCRGVVQWIINFWFIKDNYYEGLAAYHRLQREKSRLRSKA
ncbi:uncharacterized protein LOC120629992 isoform X2 [Pararge aegeria]|uniref:uncharacterized protein LOC120629992 isoform X2 n=1 Tax=Pararge aegeria TaxID=116150 RepID=UPI0019CFA8B5|nr:uncharacterized protein LOC120629992 isoform X2 [Pararge aegeria]